MPAGFNSESAVGVISHVEAMKERIPTRIAVHKQGGGKSAIEVCQG